MKIMEIMNYKVYIDNLKKINLTERKIINTINPHSYIMAKNDKLFQEALHTSDILIPDGSGIVLASKFIYKKNIKKIAGADLHNFLLSQINEKRGRVFYMGASQNTLDKIEKKIKKEYPNITISHYSPPFKTEFSTTENNTIIDKVNRFKPDILFIGMTAPKQEKWLHQHKDKLDFTIASSIGAVFDFYAGTVNRPSEIWLKLHLEWLGRLIKEPKRMWKRNFVSTPVFIFDVCGFLLQPLNIKSPKIYKNFNKKISMNKKT